MVLWLWFCAALTFASSGEVVIVLDNSGSMAWGGTHNGVNTPPNDPQRIAVLGAMVVQGLAKGSQDSVTLVTFDKNGKDAIQASVADLRTLQYAGGTPLRAALTRARSVIQRSSQDSKLIVLLTDGSPTDAQQPAELKAVLQGLESDVIGISYFREADARTLGEAYLKPLIANPGDYHSIDPGQNDVVSRTLTAFTTSYARVLGSRPDTGSLKPGQSHTFPAGRFVEEVLVAVASRDVGQIGAVTLKGPKGLATLNASGDNGCEINWADDPKHCFANRRTYATFRVPHDPQKPGEYTLTLPAGAANAEYGVILRYGLQAILQAPPAVRMGDTATLRAHLQSKGSIVDAPEILESPGFEVVVRVGKDDVVLKHEGGGKFVGSFTPTEPGAEYGEVSFRNTWLDLRAKAPLSVQGFVPLTLIVPPVDLGSWSGGRWSSTACKPLDLSKSTNADRVPLACTASAPLTCSQGANGWQVCAEAPGCCGTLPGAGDAVSVTIRGAHEHYAAGAATVPVLYQVSRTGILRCWWPEILFVLGMLFLAFVINGFVRPRSFDPAMSVKIAGKEAALRRATSLVLAEAPGGKRGFYRHARFGLTNDGHPTRKKAQCQLLLQAGPRRAAVVVEGSGLEVQDRRSKKWEPVPKGTAVVQGSTYRIGTMYLKFS